MPLEKIRNNTSPISQSCIYSVEQQKMRNNTNPISNLVDEGVARQTGKPLAIGGKGGKGGKEH